MTSFVLATANPDKAAEIVAILGDQLELLARPAHVPDVDETGETLEDNARLKARALVEATGSAAIADDTGLEVDAALGGWPGVHSALYAGVGVSYSDNVEKLLAEMSEVALGRRTARFRTVALAAFPDGSEVVAHGVVEGWITTEPRGTNGFGYDPVFVAAESGGFTFGEMSAADKRALSHRGRAFRALAGRLRSELDAGPDSGC